MLRCSSSTANGTCLYLQRKPLKRIFHLHPPSPRLVRKCGKFSDQSPHIVLTPYMESLCKEYLFRLPEKLAVHLFRRSAPEQCLYYGKPQGVSVPPLERIRRAPIGGRLSFLFFLFRQFSFRRVRRELFAHARRERLLQDEKNMLRRRHLSHIWE